MAASLTSKSLQPTTSLASPPPWTLIFDKAPGGWLKACYSKAEKIAVAQKQLQEGGDEEYPSQSEEYVKLAKGVWGPQETDPFFPFIGKDWKILGFEVTLKKIGQENQEEGVTMKDAE